MIFASCQLFPGWHWVKIAPSNAINILMSKNKIRISCFELRCSRALWGSLVLLLSSVCSHTPPCFTAQCDPQTCRAARRRAVLGTARECRFSLEWAWLYPSPRAPWGPGGAAGPQGAPLGCQGCCGALGMWLRACMSAGTGFIPGMWGVCLYLCRWSLARHCCCGHWARGGLSWKHVTRGLMDEAGFHIGAFSGFIPMFSSSTEGHKSFSCMQK